MLQQYPQLTPYQYANNNPLNYLDNNGKTIKYIGKDADLIKYWVNRLKLYSPSAASVILELEKPGYDYTMQTGHLEPERKIGLYKPPTASDCMYNNSGGTITLDNNKSAFSWVQTTSHELEHAYNWLKGFVGTVAEFEKLSDDFATKVQIEYDNSVNNHIETTPIQDREWESINPGGHKDDCEGPLIDLDNGSSNEDDSWKYNDNLETPADPFERLKEYGVFPNQPE